MANRYFFKSTISGTLKVTSNCPISDSEVVEALCTHLSKIKHGEFHERFLLLWAVKAFISESLKVTGDESVNWAIPPIERHFRTYEGPVKVYGIMTHDDSAKNSIINRKIDLAEKITNSNSNWIYMICEVRIICVGSTLNIDVSDHLKYTLPTDEVKKLQLLVKGQ